jgi:hypothetical protein
MKTFHFHPWQGTGGLGFVLGALLLLLSIQEGASTIQAGNVTVQSLPALFGKAMAPERIYHARLQFLRDNPYLCDEIDPNTTSYVIPLGERHSLRQQIPSKDGSFSFINPIALVAARGEW